jgi:hypothetical protein
MIIGFSFTRPSYPIDILGIFFFHALFGRPCLAVKGGSTLLLKGEGRVGVVIYASEFVSRHWRD